MPKMEHDKIISFLGNLHSPVLVALAMQNFFLSCKSTSGMRFHLMRDGLSDFRYNGTQ